jgi:hypothetical protein
VKGGWVGKGEDWGEGGDWGMGKGLGGDAILHVAHKGFFSRNMLITAWTP